MAINLSIVNILADFQSGQIDKDELEEIIEGLVKAENPESEVDEFEYTEDGIKVILVGGEIIEIDIDWDEIILT